MSFHEKSTCTNWGKLLVDVTLGRSLQKFITHVPAYWLAHEGGLGDGQQEVVSAGQAQSWRPEPGGQGAGAGLQAGKRYAVCDATVTIY